MIKIKLTTKPCLSPCLMYNRHSFITLFILQVHVELTEYSSMCWKVSSLTMFVLWRLINKYVTQKQCYPSLSKSNQLLTVYQQQLFLGGRSSKFFIINYFHKYNQNYSNIYLTIYPGYLHNILKNRLKQEGQIKTPYTGKVN